MKVSKAKRAEIRRKLVESAIELFMRKGLSETTMREISTRAGCSPTTIYNYFTSREKIFYAYFDIRQDDLARTLADIPDFAEYGLKERLQIALESLLDLYLGDREFVRLAYKALLDSPMRTFSELALVKEKFLSHTRNALAAAAEAGELRPLAFEGFIVAAYWEYAQLVVLYWLADTSEGFTQTSQVIDMSLDLVVELVRGGLVAKSVDLVTFLLKSHLYGNADRIVSLLALLARTLPREGAAGGSGTRFPSA